MLVMVRKYASQGRFFSVRPSRLLLKHHLRLSFSLCFAWKIGVGGTLAGRLVQREHLFETGSLFPFSSSALNCLSIRKLSRISETCPCGKTVHKRTSPRHGHYSSLIAVCADLLYALPFVMSAWCVYLYCVWNLI